MPTSFDWLKVFDRFKVPITTYITATDTLPEQEKELKRYKDKKFRKTMGSLAGGLVSIVYGGVITVFIGL